MKTHLNIENFKRLREFIASLPPHKVNMCEWLGNLLSNDEPTNVHCGTVGCIGGWCEAQFARPEGKSVSGWLGLSEELRPDLTHDEIVRVACRDYAYERDLLFYGFPNGPDEDADDAGVNWYSWVLSRLDRIIETGEIEPWQDVPACAPDLHLKAVAV